MPSICKYYTATIPAVVLAKNYTEVNLLMKEMTEAGMVLEEDWSGVNFKVESCPDYVEGYLPEKEGPYSPDEQDLFVELIWKLTNKNLLQLVHKGTYDSSEWCDPTEEQYERQLKEAFYEGLFSHSL